MIGACWKAYATTCSPGLPTGRMSLDPRLEASPLLTPSPPATSTSGVSAPPGSRPPMSWRRAGLGATYTAKVRGDFREG